MKLNLYLIPVITIDFKKGEFIMTKEEFKMNLICQVPHWAFVDYEDINFVKEKANEKLITKAYFIKMKGGYLK